VIDIHNVGNRDKRNAFDIKQRMSHEEFNRPEYLQKLEADLLVSFGEAATKRLMSKDFNAHIKCIANFRSLMVDSE
jgi:hypothetical protein